MTPWICGGLGIAYIFTSTAFYGMCSTHLPVAYQRFALPRWDPILRQYFEDWFNFIWGIWLGKVNVQAVYLWAMGSIDIMNRISVVTWILETQAYRLGAHTGVFGQFIYAFKENSLLLLEKVQVFSFSTPVLEADLHRYPDGSGCWPLSHSCLFCRIPLFFSHVPSSCVALLSSSPWGINFCFPDFVCPCG